MVAGDSGLCPHCRLYPVISGALASDDAEFSGPAEDLVPVPDTFLSGGPGSSAAIELSVATQTRDRPVSMPLLAGGVCPGIHFSRSAVPLGGFAVPRGGNCWGCLTVRGHLVACLVRHVPQVTVTPFSRSAFHVVAGPGPGPVADPGLAC